MELSPPHAQDPVEKADKAESNLAAAACQAEIIAQISR